MPGSWLILVVGVLGARTMRESLSRQGAAERAHWSPGRSRAAADGQSVSVGPEQIVPRFPITDVVGLLRRPKRPEHLKKQRTEPLIQHRSKREVQCNVH